MKTKRKLTLRQVGDENIIIAGDTDKVDFTRIISLNESAARLWKEVSDKDFTEKEITGFLLEWYEVDEETAAKDAKELINAWLKAGIIEE